MSQALETERGEVVEHEYEYQYEYGGQDYLGQDDHIEDHLLQPVYKSWKPEEETEAVGEEEEEEGKKGDEGDGEKRMRMEREEGGTREEKQSLLSSSEDNMKSFQISLWTLLFVLC